MAAGLGSPAVSQKGVRAAAGLRRTWLEKCPGVAPASREVRSGGLATAQDQRNLTLPTKAASGCPRGRCSARVGAKCCLCQIAVCTGSFPSAAIRDLGLTQAGNHGFKARGVFSHRHVPGRQPECPALGRMVCDRDQGPTQEVWRWLLLVSF